MGEGVKDRQAEVIANSEVKDGHDRSGAQDVKIILKKSKPYL